MLELENDLARQRIMSVSTIYYCSSTSENTTEGYLWRIFSRFQESLCVESTLYLGNSLQFTKQFRLKVHLVGVVELLIT